MDCVDLNCEKLYGTVQNVICFYLAHISVIELCVKLSIYLYILVAAIFIGFCYLCPQICSPSVIKTVDGHAASHFRGLRCHFQSHVEHENMVRVHESQGCVCRLWLMLTGL